MTPQYERHDTVTETRADGTILYRAGAPLGSVVDRATDWLDDWADRTPDAVFLAERSGDGWREAGFAEIRDRARALAGGLLDLGLGPDGPIMILSGNSLDHGVLSLAAQYIGVPFVPLAEQYALIPAARGQIDHVASVVRPGAVFAEDGAAFADVLSRDVFDGLPKIVGRNASAGMTQLSDLERSTADIATALAAVGPDSVAKILMTSGSTSSPKGVPTTQRMICTNQTQIAQGLPFLKQRPPCIVDWLPWNHVFGGSHNFNMMLANGGALYIDGGKPAPHLIGKTLENLALKAGTMTFNVPAGFAMIRDALAQDAGLRDAYFRDLDMLFYAGASLPQDVWADLEGMAREVRGDMPLFTSSWGLTETAPAALLQHQPTDRSGVVGVPLPGVEVKLIPDNDGRMETRVRGPSIFGGYLRQAEASADAFDEEGFFRTGDAMTWIDPEDPDLGLRFDGRISEAFKLLSGTWVRAASLRLKVLEALGGLVSDVVIAGADRADVGVLLIPSATTRDGAVDLDGALSIPALGDVVRSALSGLGGSSSTRVRRAMFLSEPPSIADGEITAKGNINFRKLQSRRAQLVDRLYSDKDPAVVLV